MKKLAPIAVLVLTAACLLSLKAATAQTLQNGLTVHLYQSARSFERLCPVVEGQTPNAAWDIQTLDLNGAKDFAGFNKQFVVRVSGELLIDKTGTYEFELRSDDGSRLVIDTTTVIANDGKHAATSQEGQMTLTAGSYPFHVDYFQADSGQSLRLSWRIPGAFFFSVIPATNLRTEANQVHVTSPGSKNFLCAGGTVSQPGDGRPLEGVHPSFDLTTVRPANFQPQVGGMGFLPDGRLAVATWDPVGAVYLLDGVTGSNPEAIKVKRFAYGLGEPLGLLVRGNEIYIAQKKELVRLVDTNGDSSADVYETVAGGWPGSANFHEFTFGLAYKDGAFWVANSVAIDSGGTTTTPQPALDRGTLMKVTSDGRWEFIASGLRTPNGMGLGPDGEVFGCDNQGSWVPASKIMHYRAGQFYGHHVSPPGRFDSMPAAPPAVWMPHGEISKSPAELVLVPNGAPHAGQLLVADVTHGGVKRAYLEKVAGQYQGAAFRFTQGLEAGINRLTFGPDGALYVGGVGHAGNWGHNGTRFGLQRLRPNGKPTFEIATVQTRADGFELTLTRPVPPEILREGSNYEIKQWRYEPTAEYGGPKIDEQPLRVRATALNAQHTRVFLKIDGLQKGRVVYIRLKNFLDTYGVSPWSTEAWYTLNEFGADAGPSFTPDEEWEGSGGVDVGVGVTPPAGSIILYDGTNTNEWQNKSWSISSDDRSYVVGSGDNVTNQEFGDFRLHLEFFVESALVSPIEQLAGNSGVFLQNRYELQILDSFEKEIVDKDDVGAIYELVDPLVNAAAPPGNWQAFDVWFEAARFDTSQKIKNARVKVYLNGTLVQDSTEIEKTTAGAGLAESEAPGPIRLQDHVNLGNKPTFRNVWVCRPDGCGGGSGGGTANGVATNGSDNTTGGDGNSGNTAGAGTGGATSAGENGATSSSGGGSQTSGSATASDSGGGSKGCSIGRVNSALPVGTWLACLVPVVLLGWRRRWRRAA